MHTSSKRHAAALLLTAATATTFALPALSAQSVAAAPTGQNSQFGVYRYPLGDFRVIALSDGTVPQDLHTLLKGVGAPTIDSLLSKSFQHNPIETSINAYLIDTGSRLVLVDTGAGDFFGAGLGGKLVASLKLAGYEPAEITDILITHIHSDHSGGLVQAGKAVFPWAIVHVGKPDVDFFLAPEHQDGVDGYDKQYFRQATVSLTPYKLSGQLKPFSGPTQILPGIVAIPTPGHTPGHSFYRIQSKGESLTFIGDIIHAEPVQFSLPKVTITYDVNQPAAAKQRIVQFNALAQSRARVAAAHLPFPGIGYIQQQGPGFSFEPVVYRDRDGQ